MSRYTLDFSNEGSPNPRPRIGFRQRLQRTARRTGLPLGVLAVGIALVSLQHQRTQMQVLRSRYDAQVLRYDSLLAVKLLIERQLALIRVRQDSSFRLRPLRETPLPME